MLLGSLQERLIPRSLSTNFRLNFCIVYFTTLISRTSCRYAGYVTIRCASDMGRATSQVSRYLNGVTYCREIWSDAYRKAEFVHRPGPFPSQSTHNLEHALVSSFRVDRNLRLGGKRPAVKPREIQYTDADLGASLVFGQFLLVAFSEEVRCYDLNLDVLDSSSCASIVYQSTGGTLKSFHCVSANDIEGHPFACVVLGEESQTAAQM